MADRNLTVQAFTLSSFNIRGSDRLLRLLTKEHGLLTAYAGGAARPKSPLVACSMPFTLAEFVLYQKQGRFSVRSADIIYAFHGIHGDFDRLSEASRLAQLFEDAARFDSGISTLYDLFAYALYAVADRPDPAWLSAVAAFRLMALIGFAPFLDTCVVCQERTEAPFAFSREAGGMLCRQHRVSHSGLTYLSEEQLNVLRAILLRPLERVFVISVNDGDRRAMIEWIWRYLEFTMEKAYPGFALPEAFRITRDKEQKT